MPTRVDDHGAVLLGVNVNLQYASIPKRRRGQMVACLEQLLDAVEELAFVVSIYFTGVSAEWLAEHRSDLTGRVRQLSQQGTVEVGSHTYAHAVLTLLPERDQIWQVEWGDQAVETVFGDSNGLFVPEFGFGRRTAKHIAKTFLAPYVIGPLGPKSIDGFRMPIGRDELVVIRPSDRYSKSLKSALMGESCLPKLPEQDVCLVSDAEYPYFARESGLDSKLRWLSALTHLSQRHTPSQLKTWSDRERARLLVRDYRPRIPSKHRRWFQGVEDFDAQMDTLRSRLQGEGAPLAAVRGLLLAENSDAYECMTQGYRGHGWDRDARAALRRALAIV
jgi:hypothetical protein